ncbi:MAG: TonB-dependent receptor, partial [Blastocatellia bacterium]|nr:TonB-dependent receptor [Blastocatellia bacterium]
MLLVVGTGLARDGGEIVGKVTDRTAGALAGAKVTLRNVATQTETTATTDGGGQYQFVNIAIGIYRLRVELTGFNTAVRNLTVTELGEKIESNFDLVPGAITEAVSVTAARGERDETEIPAKTEGVNEKELERQNNTTTQDGLTTLSNINVVGNGPFQQRPRLRGLDSSRILILVDGERLNTTRVATDRAGVEIGLIDPTSLQSVEVASSGSVLYGTDALAGTINFITQQPRAVSEAFRIGGGLNTFYSTNERGRRGTAEINLAGRKFALRVAGGLEKFENYHAGGAFRESSQYLFDNGTLRSTLLSRVFLDPFNAPFTRTSSEVPNSQAAGNSFNAVGRLFFTDKDALRVAWTRRRTDNIGFPDFSLPFFSQVLTLPFSNLDKYGVRYQRTGLTPWFTGLSVNAYHQQQDRSLRNDFAVYSSAPPRPNDPPFDSIIQVSLLTDTRQNVKSYGWDVQATFVPASRNVLTAGASYFFDHARDSRVSRSAASIIGFATRPPSPPRLIPQNISLGPASVTFPQRVPKSDYANLAFFAQDEYDITRRVRLVGAVRADRFDITGNPTPGYNPVLPGLDQAVPAINLSLLPSATSETRIQRTTVTGDLGVIVRATDDLSFTARVGRSFRHPNLEELLFSGPATVGFIIPNTQVKPETGINVDASARLRKSRYAATLTWFNNNYRNFISQEFVSNAPGLGLIAQAFNFARVRIQGVEADGEYSFNLNGSTLTPFVTMAYTRGDIREAINPFNNTRLVDVPADNISPLKAIAGFRWQDARGRFWSEYNVRAHARVERVSPLLKDSPFAIAQDYLSLRGFGIQTLRGGYSFNRERGRVSLTVGLENIGNTFY